MLSAYYHPFQFLDAVLLGIFVVLFDQIGFFFGKRLNLPGYLRPFYWVVGLAIFSFVFWLFLRVTGFESWKIIALMIFIGGMVRDRRGLESFLDALRKHWIVWLAWLPLMPIIFVKVSLPPNIGDEFYHYYSPAEIKFSELLQKGRDLYYYLPASLDNIYRITFAITHSVVVARLLHLFIGLSAIWVAGLWLEERWNKRVATIWWIGSPYLATTLISYATSGLVDMGTAAVVLVGIICSLDYLEKASFDLLMVLAALAGVGMGFKYSSAIPFMALFLIASPRIIRTTNLRHKLGAVAIFIATGGFWLIRNAVLKGNPVYPLGNLQSFFAGWTIPLTLAKLPELAHELSTGSGFLLFPLLVAIPLTIVWCAAARRWTFARLFIIWAIEVGIIKLLGGFILRYYFHWVFYIGLALLAPFTFDLNRSRRVFLALYSLLLFSAFTLQLLFITKFVYSSEYTPVIETSFAIQRVDLETWIKIKNPQMFEAIKYCSGEAGSGTRLMILDPDIMWFTANGQLKGFLVNCWPYYYDITKDNSILMYELSVSPHQYAILASATACLDPLKLVNLLHHGDGGNYELENYPYALKQRLVNNQLVCKGQEVRPGIIKILNSDMIKILQPEIND